MKNTNRRQFLKHSAAGHFTEGELARGSFSQCLSRLPASNGRH